jgi:hypothetical protein
VADFTRRPTLQAPDPASAHFRAGHDDRPPTGKSSESALHADAPQADRGVSPHQVHSAGASSVTPKAVQETTAGARVGIACGDETTPEWLEAAAPAMYAALQMICDSGVALADPIERAMLEALKKARGE